VDLPWRRAELHQRPGDRPGSFVGCRFGDGYFHVVNGHQVIEVVCPQHQGERNVEARGQWIPSEPGDPCS
jgi:hypothetical protein